MKKAHLCFIFLVLFCNFNNIFSITDWTFLDFMPGDSSYYLFLQTKLNDIASVGSNSRINMLAQIDLSNHKEFSSKERGSYRYKIGKNNLAEEDFLKIKAGKNIEQALVDSIKWMLSKYPAKHYLLFLSSHGSGIIDPDFSLRGILFDDVERTYLTNQNMVSAFEKIKKSALINKKIDVLCLDACSMGMVEIAYQIKDYVNILVASQEIIHMQGVPMQLVLKPMSESYCDPVTVAKNIVLSVDKFYKNSCYPYTKSAVDLSKMDSLKQNIDTVVTELTACTKIDKNLKSLIKEARQKTLQFKTDVYVDVASFYSELLSLLNNFCEKKQNNTTKITRLYDKINNLKQLLCDGIKIIEESVFISVTSVLCKRAKGLSIYFPKDKIHESYPKNKFAKDSLWLKFLKDVYL